MAQKDNYGFFGPNYSYADNIALPGSIGVRQEPTFSALIDSVAGINYYTDVIAFGSPSFFDSHNPTPMGVRYYLNTEQQCSNGATMSDYFDGITKGDLLGQRVADGLASAGLPGLRGLAPGILENARDALDPRPILSAVTATGYPVCLQVACPVGDFNGGIQDPTDPTIKYLADPVDRYGPDGLPQQIRWVQAYDNQGGPLTVSKDEFGATAKCYNPDGTYITPLPPAGCPLVEPTRIDKNQQSVLKNAPGASFSQLVNGPGNDRYKLCQILQMPTAPPDAVATEGFADCKSTEGSVIMGLSVLALLGIGLWSVCRK